MELIDLLRLAVEKGASDLHVIAGVPPVLRVNGEIVITDLEPISPDQAHSIIVSNLPQEKKQVLEQELQLCYSYKDPYVGYFRVSIYYEQGIPGASVRICNSEIKSWQELSLPPIMEDFARTPSGLILITGPTGSGKTTTMNALIDFINRERSCKIIMVEDPIEYIHSNKRSIVIQQELYTDTKSFSRALIHILRQDPNVIAIGEMRDLETISTALTAAETGHLVISTLHTPDAPQTVDRIIDVFPPDQQNQVRQQLAGCLQAVISQQLLPRVDQPGRILATELMIATQAVRNIIREDRDQTLYGVIETGYAHGMRTMDHCLKDYYQQGIITYDTAVTHAVFPDQMRDLLGARAGH